MQLLRSSGGAVIAMVLVLTGSVLLVRRSSAAPELTFRDCALPGATGPVACATFDVPEDRERRGRTISLNIAVLKATGPARKPDPIVPLQGGPGQGAVPLADFYARTLAPLREERDIVLIDVRGTGRSNPLTCNVAAPESLRSGDMLPAEAIRACRKAHESRADLRLYTTDAIARDLDDVRRAMRVERWNLYGTSYGTRLGQEYVRRFGSSVRTVTMKGIVPPSLAIPLPYARDAQVALEASIDARTRTQLSEVLAGLRSRPVTIAHEGRELTISEGLFAEALRNLLYNPASAPAASRMIQSAAAGDFQAAAATVLRVRTAFSGDLSLGMFLSVTCAEDIPRIDAARIDEMVRGTFLGSYRIRQQMEACRHWPAGTRLAGNATPVVSDVPALLFSGDLDPVTPPRFGQEVVRSLPNGRHIVLKNNGHAIGPAAPCVAAIMKPFIDRASVRGLNTACAALD